MPCAPVEPGAAEVRVVLRTLPAADGASTAVPAAYASIEELVRACDDAQPWVTMCPAGVTGLPENAPPQVAGWRRGAAHGGEPVGQREGLGLQGVVRPRGR